MLLPEGVAHRRPVLPRTKKAGRAGNATGSDVEGTESQEGTSTTPTGGEAAETPGNDSEPPMAGTGSGREAWVKYAEAIGIEVSEDMTRTEIIEKVQEV